MSAIHHFIINQKARALSDGIKIIRDVLKSNPFPNGFTTAQLFEVAVQQPPPPDFPAYHHTAPPPKLVKTKDKYRKVKPVQPWAPSHPEHPIRSIRFLKGEVLPALEEASEIRMVRQQRLIPLDVREKMQRGRDPGFEFVWKVTDPNDAPPPRRSIQKKKEVVGKEVGVGLDNEHLNIRRQNARVGKITRDVEAMKSLKSVWEQNRMTAKDRMDNEPLNIRPQNARVDKITREVEAMKSLKSAWEQDRMTAKDRMDNEPLNIRPQNARVGKTTQHIQAMNSNKSVWEQGGTTPKDRRQ